MTTSSTNTPVLSASKEDLEKQKLAIEIQNLRRQWSHTIVQYGGLLIAIIALAFNSWTASYDRRQAVLERDQAKLDLKLTQADLAQVTSKLEGATKQLSAKQVELDEAGQQLLLVLNKTVEANSPAMQEWAKREFSEPGILRGMADHLRVLTLKDTAPAMRDNCVRGINAALELYPDIKDMLVAYSKELKVDPQVWLSPSYSTTEEESTEFVLKWHEERLRKQQSPGK